jgi:hypothetical protein
MLLWLGAKAREVIYVNVVIVHEFTMSQTTKIQDVTS